MKNRITNWFKYTLCRHEFDIKDIKKTNIPEPPKPTCKSTFSEAMDYYMTIHAHPSNTERIEWACAKCGKAFRAYCGLDILSKHSSSGKFYEKKLLTNTKI